MGFFVYLSFLLPYWAVATGLDDLPDFLNLCLYSYMFASMFLPETLQATLNKLLLIGTVLKASFIKSIVYSKAFAKALLAREAWWNVTLKKKAITGSPGYMVS